MLLEFKKLNRRVAIIFSKILLNIGRIDIGLYLLRHNLESALWIGITNAYFNLSGNTPDVKESLNILVYCPLLRVLQEYYRYLKLWKYLVDL